MRDHPVCWCGPSRSRGRGTTGEEVAGSREHLRLSAFSLGERSRFLWSHPHRTRNRNSQPGPSLTYLVGALTFTRVSRRSRLQKRHSSQWDSKADSTTTYPVSGTCGCRCKNNMESIPCALGSAYLAMTRALGLVVDHWQRTEPPRQIDSTLEECDCDCK